MDSPATGRAGRRARKHQTWIALGVASIVAAMLPLQAAAQIEVKPEPTQKQAPADVKIENGAIQLGLDQAIAIALRHNLALVSERYNRQQSEFRISGAQGIYDYTGTVDASASSSTTPSASTLTGARIQQNKNERFNLGLSRLLPTGGTASVALNNSRFSTNNRFQTLNPEYDTSFQLTFQQPLLRDFGRMSTEHQIDVARTNFDISKQQFTAQVISTVQQVEDAYWNLVDAQDQLKVAEEALQLAKELHEQNKIRVKVGTLAPLELVQSEVGVAEKQEGIIAAQSQVGDAADALRSLLNLQGDRLWSVPIDPVTKAEAATKKIDVEEAIQTALKNRPEVRSQELTIENLKLDSRYYHGQLKPRLDLNVNYGYSGIGGPATVRDFLTGEIISQAPGSYNDALRQVERADFLGWTVGLNLTVPLQNRAARAQSAVADSALDQGKAHLRDLELQVTTGVRTAARQVETAAQQIASAKISRQLAEKNLDAEKKKYDNGMSTSYQVLQIQDDLTQARSREASAITGYRKALVAYYSAIGRLLEENKIKVVGK